MKPGSTPAIVAIVFFALAATLTGCRLGDVLEPATGELIGGAARQASPQVERHGDRGLPAFDPGDFKRQKDNPYFPLVPGTVYRYEGETEEGLETTTVEVTHVTKTILGVRTVVVRDRVYLDGELKEDTFDWFARDKRGNVWYFGEATQELEDGEVVSTEGSWEAGVDGAAPGIIMLAKPRVGDAYAQEYAPGVAEDRARVVSLKESVEVPYGKFRHVLQTFEDTPLDPTALEDKYYARGIGLVLTVARPDGERDELVAVEKGSRRHGPGHE